VNEERFRDELDSVLAQALREHLAELKNYVWDGTGLTLAELAEEGLENVVWRDVGMTLPELIAFLEEGE
jgi:SpoVK/Ycf46/Vps4 family AAA+-type ATPase